MGETEGSREGGDGNYTSDRRLTVDIVADIVSNEYRREILNCLDTYGEPLTGESTTVEEIAKSIAARKRGTDAASGDAVERISMVLHHVHIPKLADWGVVHYDQSEGIVTPTKRASLIKTQFESVLKAFEVEADYAEERSEVSSQERSRISF